MLKKFLISFGVLSLLTLGFAFGAQASSPCLTGSGGGTGICMNVPTSSIGYNLYLSTTTTNGAPVYGFQANGTGGGSSTLVYAGNGILVNASGTNGYVVINNGVTSTANLVGLTPISISPTGTILFTNPGYVTSSTGLTYFFPATSTIFLSTSTGLTTANFATTSISQWNNDSHYVTSTSGGSLSTSSAPSAFYFPYWANATGGLSGTSTLFYSSSTGNVGIGTTNPGAILDVESAEPNIYLKATTATNPAWYTVANGTALDLFGAESSVGGSILPGSQPYDAFMFGQGSVGGLSLGTHNVVRMRIDINGNVGIGTTSPSSTLTVNGSFATGNINISTSTTLTATSSLVFWIATSSAGTVTLPTIASVAGGTCVTVTDAGGNAGTNAITVAGQGSNTINGLATTTIATNAMSLSFCSNKSSWYIQ